MPTISITLGWWLVPLFLTGVFFIIANRMLPKDMDRNHGAPWGNAVVELVLYGLATIASAIVWIVYLVWMVAIK